MSYKIVLVGSSNAGKTSLISRYALGEFDQKVQSTIGIDLCHKQLDHETHLQLWDTAGQERFKSVPSTLYRQADAIVFVYDMTDLKSFENLNLWWREFLTYGNRQQTVCILLGNKADLQATVPTETAREWAIAHDMCFEEVSALKNQNVERAFNTIVNQLRLLPEARHREYRAKRSAPRHETCCF